MDFELLAQLLVIGISRLTTGIQDLAPSAELYEKLNDPRNEVDVRYYIQIGINTEMDGPINWRKLFSKTEMTRILDKALDQVLGPNDLLVGVASARGVRGGNWPEPAGGCNRLPSLRVFLRKRVTRRAAQGSSSRRRQPVLVSF